MALAGRRDGDGHPGGVRRVLPAAGAGRRRAVQAVRRGRRRDRVGRGRRDGAAGAAVRRAPQRAPGAGGGLGQRGEPGRRVQRADRAERPVAAAGDPGRAGSRGPVAGRRGRGGGARDRDGAGRPDRGAGAARHLRAGPAGGPAAVAGVGEVQHRPRPGGRRGGRGDQDGAGAAARACCPRTLHADEPSPHVDWSAGDGAAADRAGALAGQRAGPPGRGVRRSGSAAPTCTSSSKRPPPPSAARRRRGCPAWRAGGGGRAGVAGVGADRGRRLRAQAGRLAAHVAARPDLDPADVAWSLATTRSAFEHRAVVIGGEPGGAGGGAGGGGGRGARGRGGDRCGPR